MYSPNIVRERPNPARSILFKLRDTPRDIVTKSERERFLEAVFASATDYAIVAMDTIGLVTSWNEGAVRVLGWTEAEMLGRPASVFFTEEDCRAGIPQREMIAALDEGRGTDERWHLRKDGSTFWANGEMLPLRDEDGLHLGFIKILRDRTPQRLAAERAHADTEFLRGVLASSTDCIKVLDLDGKLTFMNEGGKKLMEISDFNDVVGCPWPDFWQREGHANALAAWQTARMGGVGRFSGKADTMGNTPKWWDVTISPILDANGQPEKLLCVSRDVTAARQAEEQARLLSEELQHRVKNTLSIVQAMIRQTMRKATNTGEAVEALERRIGALGRAHSLLTKGGWQRSDLHRIIKAALDLHDDGMDRFTIEGPVAFLEAQAATSMALLLHELATNAIKYGSLSVPSGRVAITWTVTALPDREDGLAALDLVWRETGGPLVREPTSRGFGSKLIESALARTLKGEAVISFANEGVSCAVKGLVEPAA